MHQNDLLCKLPKGKLGNPQNKRISLKAINHASHVNLHRMKIVQTENKLFLGVLQQL